MIAVWAGLECTVNRVGPRYFDQVSRTGHENRIDDIDRIAELGVRRVRYPLLWERLAPGGPASARWDRADPHLRRLQELEISPIAGLMHHGSGPRHTSLLDRRFPDQLAAYAAAVAERYPWIDAYTPVNEPLVTARFAGLYGHWYPHHMNDASFIRMVVNQCRAIVLSMQAIRRVNPDARYIHTDDGGTVFSTASLAHQATLENLRRDLALDILYGRVDRAHPLWDYLCRGDVSEHEWSWFREQRVTPDVIGIDYYATSDRYLDHRLSGYPPASLGGNGHQRYADVAAPLHMPDWKIGFAAALTRLHAKYATPVALTEVHIGCTREEQLRWLQAAWNGARTAELAGAAVEAVTPWAIFGTYDWDSLVTCDNGHYEPGAFDVRGAAPRRTAVGHAVASLTSSGEMAHPVLAQPGWWEGVPSRVVPRTQQVRSKRLLIFGRRGTLGSTFVRHCEARGIDHLALTSDEVDIREPMEVRRAVAACRPWAVINATGYVNVDAAETDRAQCIRINTFGAQHVADACHRTGAQLLTFSTDLVFDGARSQPYTESHDTRPLNIYGSSKRAAEQAVRACLPDALIIRTSAFFGPHDEYNFVAGALRRMAAGKPVRASSCVVTPTYVPSLVDAALDLLIDAESGLWHLSNQDGLTWVQLARLAAKHAGFDEALVEESCDTTLGWVATRPRYSALASTRATLLPSVEESLAHLMHTRNAHAF